ncbi:MAG: hypothetical protein Q9179_001987 [Wetmoreana sp. 5 TL-2023]
MGLKESVQMTILDPVFDEVRKTETITYRARETVKVNWLTLLRLKSNIKIAATHSKDQKKRESVQEVLQSQPGSLSSAPAAQASSYTAPVQSTLEALSLDRALPKAYVNLVSEPPAQLPGHFTLYKAKPAAEMNGWIDEDDGRVAITSLRTSSGGDFNINISAVRHESVPLLRNWMIQVQVLANFINSLRSKELWYSRDWKEFTWYCRKRLEPPSKYEDYWKPGRADLVKGHICKSDTHVITNIKKQDVQERMEENNVMINPDGRKASQWAFVQYQSVSRFADEIRGKIHIEAIPPVTSLDPGEC